MRVASSSIANKTPLANPSTSRPGIMRWPDPGKQQRAPERRLGIHLARARSPVASATRTTRRTSRRSPARWDSWCRRPGTAIRDRRLAVVVPRAPVRPYRAAETMPSVPVPAIRRGPRLELVRLLDRLRFGLRHDLGRPRCDRFEAHAAPGRALVEHARRTSPQRLSALGGGRLGHGGSVPRIHAPRPMKLRLADGLAQPPGQIGRRSPATRARAPPALAPPPPSAGRAPDRRAAPRRRRRPAPTSLPSTSRPVSPSTSVSRAPPESPTTIGRAHADASMNTLPQPSTSMPPRRVRHGIANTSPMA